LLLGLILLFRVRAWLSELHTNLRIDRNYVFTLGFRTFLLLCAVSDDGRGWFGINSKSIFFEVLGDRDKKYIFLLMVIVSFNSFPISQDSLEGTVGSWLNNFILWNISF
jgi:hypothetical protein